MAPGPGDHRAKGAAAAHRGRRALWPVSWKRSVTDQCPDSRVRAIAEAHSEVRGLDHVDTLVAGQGLAGSLLATMLIDRGVEVRVVDPGPDGSASQAAAGILSPYTGPRYQAPENLAELLEAAHETYCDLERRLDRPLLAPAPIWRLLQTPGEAEWIDRRRHQYAPDIYMDPVTRHNLPRGVAAPHGATRMYGGGQVALGRLLSAVRTVLADAGRLIPDTVTPGALVRETDGTVRWGECRASRVIFCEGAAAFRNPWWQHLPWRRSRGETLTLRTHAIDVMPDAIVTAGKSLVPQDDGTYRLGATYDRGDAAGEPTAAARRELLNALPALLHRPPGVEVIGASAGVRPGSRPGPPFVGLHPEDTRIGILNGLGSRGTLLAPWHAARLADHIAFGTPLPARADVRQRRDLS